MSLLPVAVRVATSDASSAAIWQIRGIRRLPARCDEGADAMARKLREAGMTGNIGKEELLARARSKGLAQ